MGEKRTTRVIATAGANLAVVVEIPLPQIEGLVIIPTFISFLRQLPDQGGGDTHVGISHNRDFPVPSISTPVEDIYIHESIWVAHAFDDGQSSYHRELESQEILLAGPQAFVYLNGVNAERDIAVILTYETRRINLIQWAAIASNTSYED